MQYNLPEKGRRSSLGASELWRVVKTLCGRAGPLFLGGSGLGPRPSFFTSFVVVAQHPGCLVGDQGDAKA